MACVGFRHFQAIPYVGHLTVETDKGAIYHKFVLFGAEAGMLDAAPTEEEDGSHGGGW